MPDLPISKTQLDKLGDRLRDSQQPALADLELLAEVLDVYDETLTTVASQLRGMGFRPTGRIKISRTIIDKLRRERRSSLKTIQDLAGARVTLSGGLDEQDATVRAFCDHYKDIASPYVIDRRVDPRSGYRAVHVVVKLQAIPVEVQFRTELQHLWAQFFEMVADAWGRQIRYGGAPDPDPDITETNLRMSVVTNMIGVSREIADFETEIASDRPENVDLSGVYVGRDSNLDIPDYLSEVGSAHRRASEARRGAEAVVRRGLTKLADLVERGGQSR